MTKTVCELTAIEHVQLVGSGRSPTDESSSCVFIYVLCDFDSKSNCSVTV